MDRTVLVTGASSGIGLATALRLAADFDVTGLVVDSAAADALGAEADRRSLDLSIVVTDLADPPARQGLIGQVQPWALVNNAGYMNAGRVEDVTLAEARRQLEVMVVAPIDLAAQALPRMLSAGRGRIVNITSSAVHSATPLTGWYQANKAALRELTNSLRLELRDTGVDVIDIEPGGFRTDIWDRARAELVERRSRSDRPDLYDRAIARLDTAGPHMGDPDEVARVVAQVLTADRPPVHRRVGPGANLLRLLDLVVPDRVWDLAVAAIARAG